jgi:hypothetical protein
VELEKSLQAGADDLAGTFFRRAAKVVDIPWSIAVGNDLRMEEAVGPRTAGIRFVNWYMSKLHKAAQSDPLPAVAFHRVANLLAPPPSIMHPKVAIRVLRGNFTASGRRREPKAVRAAAAGSSGR